MPDYIERAAVLNVNFKITTRFCESKLTTARKAVQEYANEIAKIPAGIVVQQLALSQSMAATRIMGWEMEREHGNISA